KVIRCFMDFEFTSSGNRHSDLKNNGIELISIAGVFVNEEFEVISEYYSLVKPFLNIELSDFCIKLTGITQNDISTARSFEVVVNEFCDFTKNFSDFTIQYFTWGDFDEFALRKSIKINNYKGPFNALRKKIKNIQPEISNSIKYKGNLLKQHWGLQDIKCVYKMPVSQSSHNALSDAHDLNLIYTAYKKNMDFDLKFLKDYSQKLKLDKEIQRQKNILHNKKLNEDLFLSIKEKHIDSISKLHLEKLKELDRNINLNKFNLDGSIIFHKNTIHFENNPNIPNTLFISLYNIGFEIRKYKVIDDKNKTDELFIQLIFIINDNYNEHVRFDIPLNTDNRKLLKTFIKSLY
ncbi:MAG: hypothetical protein IJH34_16640, partial [Romboutsia sp.]|nr:hypothetical protein [Romboutsia sp.]